MFKINDKAPEFTLLDQDGNQVSLASFLGKKVVVYFYPKDSTPGCTKQACGFRDNYQEFKKYDITVLGISKDSVSSHKKFKDKYDLPFTLLSDPNLEVINKYGVWTEKLMFGKLKYGTKRSTFVIDEFGNIVKIFEKATPATNAAEIIEFIENNY